MIVSLPLHAVCPLGYSEAVLRAFSGFSCCRLSTAWFGVITEFDGVLVDSTEAVNIQAWLQVAEEMNLPRPLGQVLRRIQGARDEVVGLNSHDIDIRGFVAQTCAKFGSPCRLSCNSFTGRAIRPRQQK